MSQQDEKFYYYQCAEHVKGGEVHCNRTSHPSPIANRGADYKNDCHLSFPVVAAHHVSLPENVVPLLIPGMLPGVSALNLLILFNAAKITGEERLLKAEFPGKSVRITHTN